MAIAKRLAVLFFLAIVPGPFVFAQNAQAPQAPVNRAQPQVQTAEAPDGSAIGNIPIAVDSNTYEIGPRDVLHVFVWRQQDFSGSHVVRPDGRITIPLIGDMQASGLTPGRLSAQIKQALGEYLETPDVTVSVLQVNSKIYTVAGLVNRPGAYPMPVPVRVFDALNLAGGFQQWANKKDIVIIREGDERYKFNYENYVKGKDTVQNIYLQNGDTVLVHD